MLAAALPVSVNAVAAKKCCPLHRRLQPETQKSNQLKANTLAIVNFAFLCSYPLGMTCQPSTRCEAANLYQHTDSEAQMRNKFDGASAEVHA